METLPCCKNYCCSKIAKVIIMSLECVIKILFCNSSDLRGLSRELLLAVGKPKISVFTGFLDHNSMSSQYFFMSSLLIARSYRVLSVCIKSFSTSVLGLGTSLKFEIWLFLAILIIFQAARFGRNI